MCVSVMYVMYVCVLCEYVCECYVCYVSMCVSVKCFSARNKCRALTQVVSAPTRCTWRYNLIRASELK
jgi:hypothetical protein